MGVGVLPIFDPDVPDLSAGTDGKLFFDILSDLDVFAQELGLRPLGEFGFCVNEEDLAFLAKLDLHPPVKLEVEDKWFDPEECLKTIRGVVSQLERTGRFETKQSFSGFTDVTAEEVVEELREFETCLEEAKVKGALFRFETW